MESSTSQDAVSFALMTVNETLEKVFEFLPALELIRIQTVCKKWHNTSKLVLKRRSNLPHFYVTSHFKFYEEHENSYVTVPKKKRRALSYATGWQDEGNAREEFKLSRNKWHNLPKFCLVNCTDIFWNVFYNVSCESNFLNEIGPGIATQLPYHCQGLLLPTIDGILASDRSFINYETDSKDIKIFTNIFSMTGYSENFKIEPILLPTLDETDKHIFKETLSNCINTYEDLKFVLIFHKPHGCFIKLCESSLLVALKKKIVIAGCVVGEPVIFIEDINNLPKNNMFTKRLRPRAPSPEHRVSANQMVALLFRGQTMKVASVLADYEVVTVAGLKAKLSLLKTTVDKFYDICRICEQGKPTTGVKICEHNDRKSIGIMLACCSRSDCTFWYSKENDNEPDIPRNLEQQCFRETFPDFPIFGLCGIGEIGATQNIETNKNEETDLYADNLCVSGSTIFVVLSIKN